MLFTSAAFIRLLSHKQAAIQTQRKIEHKQEADRGKKQKHEREDRAVGRMKRGEET